jgi:hypothetical protein
MPKEAPGIMPAKLTGSNLAATRFLLPEIPMIAPNLLRRASVVLACALAGLAGVPAYGWQDDRVSAVRTLLERDIIPDDLPLKEVQDYAEARVPRMPELTTAEAWREEAERIRNEVLQTVVFRGEAAKWREAETRVEWLDTIAGGEGYHIKKLRYEALPGLWIPALLYEPDNLSEKMPVVMNVNGHDGKGKAAEYKQIRCINQAKRGMLALNVEWLGMGQLRSEGFGHYRMNQLDLCGTSGLAPFYLAMERGLDVLLEHPNADPERVAVAGLSGGGWQTIIISSLDPRVTLSNPVAGYSSFRTRARHQSDLGDSEQTPTDLATVADYTHLTALRAPRPTLLTFNAKDNCCFASDHALPPLLEAADPVFKLFGKPETLRSHVNYDPGNHNFERENREALYAMFKDFFFAGDETFSAEEIECSKELKTAEELNVELPSENADFHSLAMSLMSDLPHRDPAPEAREQWKRRRVEELAAIVRASRLDVSAQETGRDKQGEVEAVFWRLRIGDAWTIPAVEITSGEPESTAIILADEGRVKAAEKIAELLQQRRRVVAIDPFYFGESKIPQRDFLYGLLVATVGDRPLGIQASQIGAVARWLDESRELGPAQAIAVGPRSSLMTLVAVALEEKSLAGADLHGSMRSLKEVIEQNRGVNEAPELFNFGLLEKFDITDLTALSAPRPVQLNDESR